MLYLSSIKKQWKKEFHNPSLDEALLIFSEDEGSKLALIETLKNNIREMRVTFKESDAYGSKLHSIVSNPNTCAIDNQWFWHTVVDKIFLHDLSKIKRILSIYEYYIRQWTAPSQGKDSRRITPEDVQNAKRVPIVNFLENAERGIIKCIFHEDNHASMQIYKEENRWYCFGSCSSGGDVIDLVQRLKGMSFPEAVLFLCNK